jgi:hypothetical protein
MAPGDWIPRSVRTEASDSDAVVSVLKSEEISVAQIDEGNAKSPRVNIAERKRAKYCFMVQSPYDLSSL